MKTQSIQDLTIAEANALLAQAEEVKGVLCNPNAISQPCGQQVDWLAIGTLVAIRSVTLYYTGRIIANTSEYIVLEDAAWIADTGRWAEFVKNPEGANEIEPYSKPCLVFKGAIADITSVEKIPLVQK